MAPTSIFGGQTLFPLRRQNGTQWHKITKKCHIEFKWHKMTKVWIQSKHIWVFFPLIWEPKMGSEASDFYNSKTGHCGTLVPCRPKLGHQDLENIATVSQNHKMSYISAYKTYWWPQSVQSRRKRRTAMEWKVLESDRELMALPAFTQRDKPLLLLCPETFFTKVFLSLRLA